MSRSDGCSVPAVLKKLVPALQEFADRCDHDACRRHDEAYAQGGSDADRIIADYRLFLVARVRGSDAVAAAVFNAVRLYGASNWATDRPWHGGDANWPEEPQAP